MHILAENKDSDLYFEECCLRTAEIRQNPSMAPWRLFSWCVIFIRGALTFSLKDSKCSTNKRAVEISDMNIKETHKPGPGL